MNCKGNEPNKHSGRNARFPVTFAGLIFFFEIIIYTVIIDMLIIETRDLNLNILWDFDGTLFDTYPALVEGFIQLSRRKLDHNEVLTWLKRDSKTAFKHYGISEDRRKEYQELYNHYAKISSRPFPFLEQALTFADNNIIVTHRESESTVLLLEKYNLKKNFIKIISVEEEGFKRKPDSSSYEFVKKSYNIDLVIGDRDLDLIPARKLNIKTAAFQNRNIVADYYFDDYREFQTAIVEQITKNL